MSNATLHPFENVALNAARDAFVKHGRLPRHVVVDLPSGLALAAIPVFPHGDVRNDIILDSIRKGLAKDNARGVCTMAEAWLVTAEGGAETCGDLSIHPDRYEAVLVMIEHYDIDGGMAHNWIAKIARDAGGNPSLGEWELQHGDLEGRLVGLLAPPTGEASPCN